MPDKLKEMQALFLTEAAKYNVLPLDNSGFVRLLTPRPSAVAGRTVFTYTGENAGIPVGNAPDILDKDYTITAEVTLPKGGAQGMIATMGGRFGGYGLYLLKGKPVFVYNLLNLKRYRWEGGVGSRDWLGASLKPGKHTIVFDFKYDGPGPGKGGTGVLSVDGRELSRQKIDHTIPLLMSIDETLDIGIDTRTPVDDSYKLPFRFTGKINKLTFNLGREQLTAEDQKAAAEAVARAKD
jgi:arylsulfatase